MGETKKVVVEHYPVESLPLELRCGIESGQMVRVTVESKTSGSGDGEPTVARRSLRSFLGSAPGLYESPQEAVDFIRALRDESDR